MKIVINKDSFHDAPESLLSIGYTRSSILRDVTLNMTYEVFAISVWRSIVSYCLINDSNMTDWIPSWFCTILDQSMPDDWECNVINGDLLMVIGPNYISKGETAYTNFVLRDPGQEEIFWKRFNKEDNV